MVVPAAARRPGVVLAERRLGRDDRRRQGSDPQLDDASSRKKRHHDTSVVDSGSLPRASRVVNTAVGNRLYLTGKATLFGVRTRELAAATPIEVEKDVRAIVPTPSGDRIYLIQDSAAV